MNDEHKITQQVYAAKDDVLVADQLIGTYMPFIKAETAKFLKRPPMEGHDDELSIAMIAFHEAIGGYSRTRGAFLKYAAMLIRSRLIDYSRRGTAATAASSRLDAPVGEDDTTLGETLADERDPHEETAARDATPCRDRGADPADAGIRRQPQRCGGQLPQTAAHAGRLPESLAVCQGEPGIAGYPFADKEAAHRAVDRRQRRGT